MTSRRAAARGRARAALALAALLAGAASAAAEGAPPPEAGRGAGRAAEPAYGSSDLDRRRAESVDPSERRAAPAAPEFGAEALDPDARRGSSRPLGEVSRPPRGRGPGPTTDAPVDRARGEAELRLPRRPDVAAPASLGLVERLCLAERDLEHARHERAEALRAYKRARRDGYPRGGRRALVVEHREVTGHRLARAEAARDALADEAAEQGLEPDGDACRREP